MNQTKNRIREEFLEWYKEDPALELANGVGSFENIADWFLPKIDELLKSQEHKLREELVEMIEKEDNKWNGNGEHYANVREALNNLLSTLSTNKENEIEEIPLFKGTMDKLNKLSVIKENKNN